VRHASTAAEALVGTHPPAPVQALDATTRGDRPELEFEVVTTVERFVEIGPAWRVLWQEVGAKTFQSHQWLAAWVADMGSAYELKVGLAWWDRERLAAILPMAIHKFLGLRILEWAGQAVCDYCEGIGAPSDIDFVWASLLRSGGVDIVRLKNIASARTAAMEFFAGPLVQDGSCLKIASRWASGDAWFRTLNKKKRSNYLRGQRILEEQGAISMTCHQTFPDKALLRRLFDLKKVWLRVTDQESYLIDEAHPDRLTNLTQALAQTGRLRLFAITCGDDIVAASINIAEGVSICAFFAAYDPKYDRASPGILLMTAYTRWAFDNGFREVDYLRGDERYKLEFANTRTDLFSISRAMTLRGHAALMIHRWAARIPRSGRARQSSGPIASAYTTKAGTNRATTVAK
jgi:CelD/BcsL family acetyltransferase involved in cellulose biosynthesis